MKEETKKILKSPFMVFAATSFAGMAAFIAGIGFSFAGAFKSGETFKNYQESNEYSTAISQELTDLETAYKDEELSLENMAEYYDKYSHIMSMKHAEELLQKSESQFGKDERKYTNMTNGGLISVGSGLVAIAGGLAGMGIESHRMNKKEEKEKQAGLLVD